MLLLFWGGRVFEKVDQSATRQMVNEEKIRLTFTWISCSSILKIWLNEWMNDGVEWNELIVIRHSSRGIYFRNEVSLATLDLIYLCTETGLIHKLRCTLCEWEGNWTTTIEPRTKLAILISNVPPLDITLLVIVVVLHFSLSLFPFPSNIAKGALYPWLHEWSRVELHVVGVVENLRQFETFSPFKVSRNLSDRTLRM